MIQTFGLSRRFYDVLAVDNLSLTVKDGEVFGLLGPNGAGKTTTVRMLCCLISPTSGRAVINGYEVGKEEDSEKIRSMVGLLPETPGLYERLSAYRNLDFFGQLYGVSPQRRRERIEEMLRMLDVWDRRDEPVATFSKGMKQKIAIARAVIHEPRILFLDEPTAGLDPQASATVREFILDLRKEGGTIFLNTHNLAEAERLCDRIGVLNTQLLACGPPNELASRFWGRTSVIRVKELKPSILESIRSLDFAQNVRVEEGEILVDLENPEEMNPLIVRTIIKNGGEIQHISELKHGLEDIYMKLMGERR